MAIENIITVEGQLQINLTTGVIYFHDEETGHTVLRICGLPIPIPEPKANPIESDYMLDLNFGENPIGQKMASWEGK